MVTRTQTFSEKGKCLRNRMDFSALRFVFVIKLVFSLCNADDVGQTEPILLKPLNRGIVRNFWGIVPEDKDHQDISGGIKDTVQNIEAGLSTKAVDDKPDTGDSAHGLHSTNQDIAKTGYHSDPKPPLPPTLKLKRDYNPSIYKNANEGHVAIDLSVSANDVQRKTAKKIKRVTGEDAHSVSGTASVGKSDQNAVNALSESKASAQTSGITGTLKAEGADNVWTTAANNINTESGYQKDPEKAQLPQSINPVRYNRSIPKASEENHIDVDLSVSVKEGQRKSAKVTKHIKSDDGSSMSGSASVMVDNSGGEFVNAAAGSDVNAQTTDVAHKFKTDYINNVNNVNDYHKSAADGSKGTVRQADPKLWEFLNHGFIRNFLGIIPKSELQDDVPNYAEAAFHTHHDEQDRPNNINLNHNNVNQNEGNLDADLSVATENYKSKSAKLSESMQDGHGGSIPGVTYVADDRGETFPLSTGSTLIKQTSDEIGTQFLPGVSYVGIDHTWSGTEPKMFREDQNVVDPYYHNLRKKAKFVTDAIRDDVANKPGINVPYVPYDELLLPGVVYVGKNYNGVYDQSDVATRSKRLNPDYANPRNYGTVSTSLAAGDQRMSQFKTGYQSSPLSKSLSAIASAGNGKSRVSKSFTKNTYQKSHDPVSVSSFVSSFSSGSGNSKNKVWISNSEYQDPFHDEHKDRGLVTSSSSSEKYNDGTWYKYNNDNYFLDQYFKHSKGQLPKFLIPPWDQAFRPRRPTWKVVYNNEGVIHVDWPRTKSQYIEADPVCMDKKNYVPSVYIKVDKLDIPLCLHLNVPKGRKYTLIEHSDEKLNIKTERCESIANNKYYSAEYIQAAYLPDHQLTMYPDVILENLNFRKWHENEICDLPFPNKEMKIKGCRTKGALHGIQFYIDATKSDCHYTGLVGSYANMKIEKFLTEKKNNQTTARIVIKEDTSYTMHAILRENSSKLTKQCWETFDTRFLNFI